VPLSHLRRPLPCSVLAQSQEAQSDTHPLADVPGILCDYCYDSQAVKSAGRS